MVASKVSLSQSTGSKKKVFFPSSVIQTNGHWAVGTEWQYSKGVVTMYDEGFSCTCMKQPQRPCKHITNVKQRIYGTFEEHYSL